MATNKPFVNQTPLSRLTSNADTDILFLIVAETLLTVCGNVLFIIRVVVFTIEVTIALKLIEEILIESPTLIPPVVIVNSLFKYVPETVRVSVVSVFAVATYAGASVVFNEVRAATLDV